MKRAVLFLLVLTAGCPSCPFIRVPTPGGSGGSGNFAGGSGGPGGGFEGSGGSGPAGGSAPGGGDFGGGDVAPGGGAFGFGGGTAQPGGGSGRNGGGPQPISCPNASSCDGCCDSAGNCNEDGVLCRQGNGTCLDCTGNPEGIECVYEQLQTPPRCGCYVREDCPADYACDTTSHSCTNACDMPGVTTTCNGGCCAVGLQAGMAVCIDGSATQFCGDSGGLCSNCALSALGPVCVQGQCGCNGPSDCPGKTCNANHVCQ